VVSLRCQYRVDIVVVTFVSFSFLKKKKFICYKIVYYINYSSDGVSYYVECSYVVFYDFFKLMNLAFYKKMIYLIVNNN
jgi:hypothetical protein